MKIELIKNEANKTVGWKLVGETREDKLRLGSIRNMEFFGLGDDVIKYDGITSDPENKNLVAEVRYATKGHCEEEKRKFMERMEKKRGIMKITIELSKEQVEEIRKELGPPNDLTDKGVKFIVEKLFEAYTSRVHELITELIIQNK